MPKRKKRGITVVRNPLNFISIIHTFFFSNVVEGQLQATMLHKTHERYHLRNLHRGAMLVYCGQCKIIDFSKFETVSNWKTVQNGVKKGSCTFVLYVCMWGRSKVHSTMWAGLINFALWQLTRSFFFFDIFKTFHLMYSSLL